ncbi:hypothetical protein TWF281_011157 [Arthrobotrys megalospora]
MSLPSVDSSPAPAVEPLRRFTRGLFISEDDLEPMDLAVCSAPFTGYIPTGTEIKFRCLKQMPISMLDIAFFKEHLLKKRGVPWTANFSLSFPPWNSPNGSCIYPMGHDESYDKTDGVAYQFPSTVGQDIRIHAFGLVSLPVVLYGVPLLIQCLLVDKMYFIPLPRNPVPVPLLLDVRIFNGRKVPFKLSLFKPAFVMKPGKPELCLVSDNTPQRPNIVLCISMSASCIEYGQHLEAEDGLIETPTEQDDEHQRDFVRESEQEQLSQHLIGKKFCGAGIFFAPDSQFNVYRCLDDDINTPQRAELQTAIEALKALKYLLENTGYNFRTVVILTESLYLCDALVQDPLRIAKWAANGWKTAAGRDVENSDLWDILLEALPSRYQIQWQLVKPSPKAPAVALARKGALENIFLHEGTPESSRERQLMLPNLFQEIDDSQAGPLYDRFVDTSANDTQQRISSVIYEAKICAEQLPKGLFSMINFFKTTF